MNYVYTCLIKYVPEHLFYGIFHMIRKTNKSQILQSDWETKDPERTVNQPPRLGAKQQRADAVSG